MTNGDIAVERMRDGALRGEYLPWQDVLHDGPVPQTKTLADLSAIRARHLASSGYGNEAQIAAAFVRRDGLLSRYTDFGELVCWFEHDLYDQLQLLQVLDWLAHQGPAIPVSLIVIGTYPGIDRFVGLGQLSPGQLVGLLDTRIAATAGHFIAAMEAWRAFRKDDPTALVRLLEVEVPALPYLRGAALRLLEELPSTYNGLSLTERSVLGIIGQGTEVPSQIFSELQRLEQRPFLGDWSFWRIVADLGRADEPLVETASGRPFRHPPLQPAGQTFDEQRLRLTRAGRDVLENRRDAIDIRPLDRWLGGTHLTNQSAWRWDEEKQRLVRPW